jgi:small subunit ribosomal protein S6
MSATAAKDRLREYEVVYVLAPTADNAEAERINNKVTEIVSNFGGKLLKLDNWGRRKLAYSINKQSRGIFVYVKFVARAGVTAEIERNLRIADSVLRYQSNLLNPHVVEEVQVDPEDVKFSPVLPAEPEEELSYEQRLGLVPSAFRKQREEEDLDGLDGELEDVPDLNAEPAAAPARGES